MFRRTRLGGAVALALVLLLLGAESKPAAFAHELIVQEDADHFRTQLADGEYVSAVIEPRTSFNEALPSWNVDCPPGAGFKVELRVGRRSDDSWSPFLHVGDWGDGFPGGDRQTKFDGGAIDVDYFRSKQPYDLLQYRIRGHGSQPIRIRRVAFCLSDTKGSATQPRTAARPPIPNEKWQRRLPVPFRSQKAEKPELAGRICSPTSVAMVLAYRGVDVPTLEIAKLAYDRTHGIYGNWPRAIQAAYTTGVPGYLARFSDWESVKRSIGAGQPLIISIAVKKGQLSGAPYASTAGHLLVLTGFDERGDVAVNDPAASSAEQGQTVYRRVELEVVWMRRGGTAYVLLPRE